MKLLFDQGTPAPLRGRLPSHSVDTLAEKSWSDKDNGELLDAAEREGYEVLVTTDQSLFYQQNLARRRIGVVVLLSTDWREVRLQTRESARRLRRWVPARSLRCPFGWNDTAAPRTRAGTDVLRGIGRAAVRSARRGADPPAGYGGLRWSGGNLHDYDREYGFPVHLSFGSKVRYRVGRGQATRLRW